MTLTEEEAKTKWCPFARVPSDVTCSGSAADGAVAVNRARFVTVYCIASECMAWRWTERVCRHKKNGTLHPIKIIDDGWSDAGEYEVVPQMGYCGLAGAP